MSLINLKTAKNVYLVNLPAIAPNLFGFSFRTKTADGNVGFVFQWANGVWNGTATMPDGSLRTFGVYPGVVNWTGFLDFGLLFLSSLTAIGQGDMASVSAVLIRWGP